MDSSQRRVSGNNGGGGCGLHTPFFRHRHRRPSILKYLKGMKFKRLGRTDNLLEPVEYETLHFLCGFFEYRREKPPLLERPARDVLDRIKEIQRAQHMKIAQIQHKEREARLLATKQLSGSGDKDMARLHTRVMLMQRRNKEMAMKRYENLSQIANRLEQALENAQIAGVLSSASTSLETLLEKTGALEEIMDDLRDQMFRVKQDTDTLAAPSMADESALEVDGEDTEVEAELKLLFERKADEEAASLEMRLPSLPQPSTPSISSSSSSRVAEVAL